MAAASSHSTEAGAYRATLDEIRGGKPMVGAQESGAIGRTGGHSAVQINPDKCAWLGAAIAAREVPRDQEDVSLTGIPADQVSNFFLFLVAICHQTSPLGKPRLEGHIGHRFLIGWDYLLAKFEERCQADATFLDPDRWAHMDAADVEAVFADEQLGNRLSDTEGRAGLIQDCGKGMHRNGWKSADALFSLCEGRVATGTPNLIETLREFRAYQDPVYKKSLYFLSLMRNSGSWIYIDSNLLGPPVDYHEVRGHLRIGTIRIVDASLLRKVRAGETVSHEDDIAIRSAVFGAIMLISDLSGLRDLSRLHYFFWNIFRAVCVRLKPKCVTREQPDTLPQRYRSAVDANGDIHCPFEALCESAHQATPIIEHRCNTDYY
jgi:hypothetical protein